MKKEKRSRKAAVTGIGLEPCSSKKKSSPCLVNKDVLEYGILPHLPAKALIRFQLVCRRWRRLISSDPYFIYLQSRQSRRNSSGLAFVVSASFFKKKVGRLHLHTYGGSHVSIDPQLFGIPSYDGVEGGFYGSVVASCNGIICVVSSVLKDVSSREIAYKIFMGNPNLKENSWRWFPLPESVLEFESPVFGLTVDVVGTSAIGYKLVVPHRIPAGNNVPSNSAEYEFIVLSSETEPRWEVSKERITLPISLAIDRVAVCVDGCLYWKFGNCCLLWFDPKKERSGFQRLALADKKHEYGAIGAWNDKLCYDIMTITGIEIWSMDHQNSRWSKLHSICLEKIAGFPNMRLRSKEPREIIFGRHLVQLIPFDLDGGALPFFVDQRIYWYDMVTGEVSRPSKSAYPSFLSKYCTVSYRLFSYRRSLVSLPKHKMMLRSD